MSPNLDAIPSQITPFAYVMDPQTEVVIRDSNRLRWGMIVMPCDTFHRSSVHENADGYLKLSMLTRNRWCMVTDVGYDRYGQITFVGVYADGMTHRWSTNATMGWYAKKDSLPKYESRRDERVAKLEELVLETIEKSPELLKHQTDARDHAAMVVSNILSLFGK